MSAQQQAVERNVRLFLDGFDQTRLDVFNTTAQAVVQALKQPVKNPRQWDKLFNMLTGYLEKFLGELITDSLHFPMEFYDNTYIETRGQFYMAIEELAESLREILVVKTKGNCSMLGPHMYDGLNIEAFNKVMQYISQLKNS